MDNPLKDRRLPGGKTAAVVVGAFVLGVVLLAGYQKFSGPDSYEECVMQSMGQAENDQAALFLNAACRKMFPKKTLSHAEFTGGEPIYPVILGDK